VSGYHERLQNQTNGNAESDMPAFVDAESLRNLAAGDDDWKYVPRKRRRAAKIRAEANKIADKERAIVPLCVALPNAHIFI